MHTRLSIHVGHVVSGRQLVGAMVSFAVTFSLGLALIGHGAAGVAGRETADSRPEQIERVACRSGACASD